MKLAMKDMETR